MFKYLNTGWSKGGKTLRNNDWCGGSGPVAEFCPPSPLPRNNKSAVVPVAEFCSPPRRRNRGWFTQTLIILILNA